MKLSKLALALAALAGVMLITGTAEAARLYFSTSATSPTERITTSTGTNPVIPLTVGDTVSVYIWGELVPSTTPNPDQDPGDPDDDFFYEQFNGMGLDLARTNTGMTLNTGTLGALNSNPDFVVDNPSSRWGTVGKGTFGGGFIFDNANFVKVGGSAYGQPGSPGYVVAQNSARLGRLDLEAATAGTTDFFFGVGAAGISFQNQAPGYPINFGWGDAAIAGTSTGTQSTGFDIRFTVVAAPVSDDSIFTMVSPADASTQNFNLLLNANGANAATAAKTGTTTGDYTLSRTGIVASTSPTGGSVAAGPVSPINYTYTVDTSGYTGNAAPAPGSVTLDNVNNNADPNDTFSVNARVGSAVTNGVVFGTALTGAVGTGGSYANLASRTSDGITNITEGGATVIGSTATILAGTNATGGAEIVSMEWRARTLAETSVAEGGTGSSPPLDGQSGLTSDVVRVTGLDNTYVLQMSYDENLLPNGFPESTFAALGLIYLATFDTGSGEWVNAVDTNGGVNTTNPALINFQGSYAASGAGLTLGAWGVDTTTNLVWAVVDHTGQFASVPEPSTLALLGLGVAGLVVARRRRKA